LINTQPIRKPTNRPRKQPARNVIPPPLEEDIKKSIIEYLRLHRWFPSVIKEHWNRNSRHEGTGSFSEPGIPDVVAIKDGRVVMLEIKRPPPYGVVRNSQREWHGNWLAHGGEVYVVCSIDDVKNCIEGGAL